MSHYRILCLSTDKQEGYRYVDEFDDADYYGGDWIGDNFPSDVENFVKHNFPDGTVFTRESPDESTDKDYLGYITFDLEKVEQYIRDHFNKFKELVESTTADDIIEDKYPKSLYNIQQTLSYGKHYAENKVVVDDDGGDNVIGFLLDTFKYRKDVDKYYVFGCVDLHF